LKRINTSLVLILLLVLAAGAVWADKGRKLPADAYIKTAKIEVIEAKGDTARINIAIAMLDSLLMHYGPRPEAYYWMSKIMIDLTNLQPTPQAKLPYLQHLVAYVDSLGWSCEEKSIQKKLREKCGDWTTEIDTARFVIWGDFYNDGIAHLTAIDDLKKSINDQPDSATKAAMKSDLEMLADTTRMIIRLAIITDSTDDRGLRAMASAFEKMKQFDSAIVYLEKAVPHVDNKLDMWTAIAYDYIQMDDFCGAIPWFQMWVDTALAQPGILDDQANRDAVTTTMGNLSICMNNCKRYDEAFENFKRLLEIDSANADALIGCGRYYRQMAINASDSANASQKAGQEAAAKNWREKRDGLFDSSIDFLGKAVAAKPEDTKLLDELALLLVIRGRYQEGHDMFRRLVELDSVNTGAWTSIGDCNINLGDYKAAADAYERVIALNPTDKAVLERLVDLYSAPEARNEKRKTEIEKMLKNL